MGRNSTSVIFEFLPISQGLSQNLSVDLWSVSQLILNIYNRFAILFELNLASEVASILSNFGLGRLNGNILCQ